ncbi:putative bifunctional diguanylate cyclase/phosphodiesterase [Tumidithrix elongata]|uniref:putative bifunctional diguanylate cyclase/phosphodiesterase n=1 Tax=Tumidithrix elongata TaxID=3088357 RepID=UPI002ED3B984
MRSEYKLTQEALHIANDRIQVSLETVPGIASWISSDLHYLGVNRHLADLLNLPQELLIGKEIGFLHPDSEFSEFIRYFFSIDEMEANKEVMTEIHGVPMHFLIVAQKYNQNQSALVLGIDITARKHAESALAQAEAKYRYEACFDSLTGLLNRKQFNQELQASLLKAEEQFGSIAILFLDLDRFQIVNDSLGHMVGDRLLQAVSQRLRDAVGEGNLVARWGGDEFTILLLDVRTIEDAVNRAKIVLDTLKPSFTIDGYSMRTSGSIGISLYPFDGKNGDTLIKNADAALYYAKAQGRNNFQTYSHKMNSDSFTLLALRSSMHTAIENHEFVIHFQPKVNAETSEITGVEALIRWQHPELGLISPSQFIPLAEDNGLIVTIGEWLLRNVCKQSQAWQDAGLKPVTVGVNLSARQFLQPNLVMTIANILAETGLAPQWLELEITESLAMNDLDYTSSVLEKLYEMGVQIAIDDFGTGHSSLSALKKFPIHTLKIDRSFIQEIASNPHDKAIVGAIVSLAKGLNLNVVVEGVETIDQLNCLRSLECDQVQGFFFSPPMPVELITEMLALDTIPTEFNPIDKLSTQPSF